MSQALELARSALAGAPVWVVGGAVRDKLLGERPKTSTSPSTEIPGRWRRR